MSLRKAEADFTLRPGTSLNVEVIRHAIRSYGFTPTRLEFTVKAELTTHEGKPVLRTLEAGQFIRLAENPQLDALRKALSKRSVAAIVTAMIPEGEQEGAAITSFVLPEK